MRKPVRFWSQTLITKSGHTLYFPINTMCQTLPFLPLARCPYHVSFLSELSSVRWLFNPFSQDNLPITHLNTTMCVMWIYRDYMRQRLKANCYELQCNYPCFLMVLGDPRRGSLDIPHKGGHNPHDENYCGRLCCPRK